MVEECLVFSIDAAVRDGVFNRPPGAFCTSVWRNSLGKEVSSVGFWVAGDLSGNCTLRFSYTASIRGKDVPVEYTVQTVTGPCGFVRFRRWFLCPLEVHGVPCRRRVSKLYLPPGAKYFGCRHCYNLTYRSRKKHNKTRDMLKKLPVGEMIRKLSRGRF
jgi:hypothetical protein